MKLEKIKIMNTEEVGNFKRKVYGAGSEKKQLSSDYCAKNINELIDKHNDYYHIHIKNAYSKQIKQITAYNDKLVSNNNIFLDVKNKLNKHFCNCGNPLRYIYNFGFVGCPNYRDVTEQHMNINYRELSEIISYEEFSEKYEFPSTYLNDFKKHYNLNFIMSSILYEYLIEVYKQPCYCKNLNYNSYQSGVNSSKQSKKEELIIKSICDNKFNLVQSQVHFSLYIDGKYSVRIPDIICSRGNEVIVFDIKKNAYNIDILKLDLYEEIVKTYLKSINDNREVKSFHIIYSDEDSENLSFDDRTINIKELQDEF